MDPKVYGMLSVENAHLCLLRWWLALVWFSLTELGDGFRTLPSRIAEGSVESWGVIDTGCFRTIPNGLVLRGAPRRWSFSLRAR